MKLVPIILLSIIFLSACHHSVLQADKALLQLDSLEATGKFSQADLVRKVDSFISIFGENRDSSALGNAYRFRGYYFGNMGMYDSSLRSFIYSQQYIDSAKDPDAWHSTTSNIGNTWYNLGDTAKAINLNRNALFFYHSKNRHLAGSNQAYNLAQYFSEIGQADSAAKYAQWARNEKLNIPDSLAIYKEDLPDYVALDIRLRPTVYFDSVVALKSHTTKWLHSFDKAYYAGFFASILNVPLPQSFLTVVLDSVKKNLPFVNDFPSKIQVYKDISSFYRKLNLLDSAMYYTDKSLQLESTYQSEIKSGMLANVAEYNGKVVRNYRVQQLSLENSKRRNRNIALGISLLLLALLTLSIYLFYRNRANLSKKQLQLKNAEVNELLSQQELTVVNAYMEGQDKERQRIAQELHDDVGSSLSLAKLHFSEMEQEIKSLESKNRKRYLEFSHLLEKTLDDVRRISHDLHGSTVLKLGLEVAVQQLAHAVEHTRKIVVKAHCINLPPMEYEIEINLYRVLQELLSNSLKYANASRIDVQFLGENGRLHFSYEENGVGFDRNNSAVKLGIGLKNMESRIHAIGGSFHLESSPGRGMVFMSDIPISTSTV